MDDIATPVELQLPENMPLVVAVGGLKGGIGKSTLAVFVALVYAIVHDKKVLLVDADPSSQTSYDWWISARNAGTPLPIEIESWSNARVGDLIVDRTPGHYDVVVVDCGGHSEDVLRSAVQVANFVLLATTAFKADLRRIAATFQAAAKAARDAGRASQIKASCVMLCVDNRMDARNELRRDKLAERLPLLEAQTSYRPAVYAEAFEMLPPKAHLAEVEEVLIEMGAVEAAA